MGINISTGLNLTENAIKVLEKRYLRKNEQGEVVESPEEMFQRVARAIAVADKLYGATDEEVDGLAERFYNLMTSLEFLPNSPTLMNAGTELGQLSACFVLPVDDSMDGIFEAVKHAAIIHKSGGGTGFSFSRLRPKGDVVGSTKGISSGPVSFMSVFDVATETVKQGGRRRGANMGMLRVDHPDILEFITCKNKEGAFSNFNISVALTEEFMKKVKEDGDYELINPRTGKPTGKLRARKVFDLIVKQAWANGEPGIVFLDRINAKNPTPEVGEIESTNPCGEQPLLPYESCNLGSINLAKMIRDNEVDWDKLREVTHLAVHFLDNVIDVNRYPIPQIEEMTKANRKIGLGVMGWADMLIQLGIPYNTPEALEMAERVMSFIQKEAKRASQALAEKRGVFPNYSRSIYRSGPPMRNATVTTIAPTGSLSIIAGCSSGIEPLFAVSFVRNVLDGTKLFEVNPYFEKIAREKGFYSQELIERIADTGSVSTFAEVPEDVKRLFVTAHDITPEDHIRMQAAFQKYVDNAVSKTVNFPNHATEEDVRKVYLLAYELGCKGVTVYRDGSREEQVLRKGKGSAAEKPSEAHPPSDEPPVVFPRQRPQVVKGTTWAMKTGCGNLYVTVNEDEQGRPFEVFNHIGKAGGCAASQSEAIGRLVSLALRCNIAPEEIIKQLKGISCHQQVWGQGGKISSCADAIAKALEIAMTRKEGNGGNGHHHSHELIGSGQKAMQVFQPPLLGACPECGGAVEHEGGCVVCHNCGFTKCG
ncbi:MAG: vitamin B12-dependent ribonucleotide reductase [Nitrospirae bacterium]|nr:MAG: vitamin B12-dependent ribonucleotide reductase [Nitrospirota bacterium]